MPANDASPTVRIDLSTAHDRAWSRLAQPARWWTGAERLAMPAEARPAAGCRQCQARNASLSPECEAGRLGGTVVDDQTGSPTYTVDLARSMHCRFAPINLVLILKNLILSSYLIDWSETTRNEHFPQSLCLSYSIKFA